MRLCFGSYFTILTLCKANKVDNKVLCETLFHSVALDYEFTYNGQPNADRAREDISSKLRRCEQNVPDAISTSARAANTDDISKYFKNHILPLLNENMIKHIILALKDVISKDPPVQEGKNVYGIDDDTQIDRINGITKRALASHDSFCPHTFLAGVFIYVVTQTNNRSGSKTIKLITGEYIATFKPLLDTITLRVDDETKLPSNTFICSGTQFDTEMANDFAGELLDKLTPLVKPDTSLFSTLSVEANGKCLKCGETLAAAKRGTLPVENWEIVYLTTSSMEEKNYNNAVALCKNCAALVPVMSDIERVAILNDKRRLAEYMVLFTDVSGVKLSNEIEAILREVDSMKNETDLAQTDLKDYENNTI